MPRIYLSPPHMSGFELELVYDAFVSNRIGVVRGWSRERLRGGRHIRLIPIASV